MGVAEILAVLYGLTELGIAASDLYDRFNRGEVDEETLKREWEEMQRHGKASTANFEAAIERLRTKNNG